MSGEAPQGLPQIEVEKLNRAKRERRVQAGQESIEDHGTKALKGAKNTSAPFVPPTTAALRLAETSTAMAAVAILTATEKVVALAGSSLAWVAAVVTTAQQHQQGRLRL
ncbi:hypothetical protein PG984_015148 [Apiospora sp. TS-2023a]